MADETTPKREPTPIDTVLPRYTRREAETRRLADPAMIWGGGLLAALSGLSVWELLRVPPRDVPVYIGVLLMIVGWLRLRIERRLDRHIVGTVTALEHEVESSKAGAPRVTLHDDEITPIEPLQPEPGSVVRRG
jgi:hypothetical protein